MQFGELNKNVYLSIAPDGKIRIPSTKDNPYAVKREYEDKETKEVKVKYELLKKNVSGYISKIDVVQKEFGTLLNIVFETDRDGSTGILSVNTNSKFGIDLMKKLPNVDFSKPVKFQPFSFISDDTKKEVRGVSIYQDDNKLDNHFYDAESKKNLNGFPEADKAKLEEIKKSKDIEAVKTKKIKSFWISYFEEIEQFLITFTMSNTVEKLEKERDAKIEAEEKENREIKESQEELEQSIDNVPF